MANTIPGTEGATVTQPPTLRYIPRQPAKLSLGVVTTNDPNLKATTIVNIPIPRVRPQDIDRDAIMVGIVILLAVVFGLLVGVRHG